MLKTVVSSDLTAKAMINAENEERHRELFIRHLSEEINKLENSTLLNVKRYPSWELCKLLLKHFETVDVEHMYNGFVRIYVVKVNERYVRFRGEIEFDDNESSIRMEYDEEFIEEVRKVESTDVTYLRVKWE